MSTDRSRPTDDPHRAAAADPGAGVAADDRPGTVGTVVGAAVGAMVGGLAGRASGMVSGPVGSVVGAAVGAVVGGLAGTAADEQAGTDVDDGYPVFRSPAGPVHLTYEQIADAIAELD